MGRVAVNAYTTTRNGWIVGVAISKAALDAPVWRLQLLFASIGAVCVGLSLSFAWIIGRRFSNGTRLLQNAAMTMSNEKNVEPQATGVREYDGLMAAFSKTSLLLLGRAKEKQRADAAEAALSERRKIFSQMHDSLGASLVGLIFHLRHATDWKGAQQKARQTLTELRLLVDSSLPESETIESVLAGGRHRMQSSMELSGVNVVWKVEELPSRPMLSPECTLNLRLILMEALNNIIQHAAARTAIISASYDKDAHAVTISVADDGCGFELASVRAGHGLQSIKARTKKLLLPSTVSIDSSPGKGTTVQIKIDWPADELESLDHH